MRQQTANTAGGRVPPDLHDCQHAAVILADVLKAIAFVLNDGGSVIAIAEMAQAHAQKLADDLDLISSAQSKSGAAG